MVEAMNEMLPYSPRASNFLITSFNSLFVWDNFICNITRHLLFYKRFCILSTSTQVYALLVNEGRCTWTLYSSSNNAKNSLLSPDLEGGSAPRPASRQLPAASHYAARMAAQTLLYLRPTLRPVLASRLSLSVVRNMSIKVRSQVWDVGRR